MRCNIKCKELPKRCPKCNKKLKSEKCTCGHVIFQQETNIPHETFTIMEDDEPYCKGIVFYLKDLKPKKTNFDRITENEETFVNWIYKHYQCMPEDVPCPMEDNTTCNEMNCKKCFKEWLQKECEE